jgi:hypothetical protein
MKKKREYIHNLWISQNLNIKMIEEGQPDRACEQSTSEINRLEMEITVVAATHDRRSHAQLIMSRMNSYQLEDQPEIMDYEESRPTIRSSPILETSP